MYEYITTTTCTELGEVYCEAWEVGHAFLGVSGGQIAMLIGILGFFAVIWTLWHAFRG